jgi:hypothetical protein
MLDTTIIRGVCLVALGALLAAAGDATPAGAQEPRFQLEIEAGPAWQGRNDVEIPNDGTATRFSLRDVAGSGPWPAARAYVTWRFAERHSLRLLAAPFSLTETGAADLPLRFAGADFLAQESLEATYTFNSYRLTYRWRFHAGERTTAWVGFTAKVRDASIALSQGATVARKDDLGFVPLLHLAGDWRPHDRWNLSLDADALAGGPGRAVDASLGLGYRLDERWSLRSGYRTVEGGADVGSVYAFAWLHYAWASVVLRW